MSITTYAELQTAMADRLGRTDFTATVTQECIAMCESRMQRRLRTLDMTTKNAAFSIAAEYVACPAGFLSARTFYLNTSPVTNLEFMPSDTQKSLYAASGKPKYYSIEGTGANFHFAPVPDGTYTATLIYDARFTPLSGSATTNWIITNHPDVYLYGSLLEAAIRIKDGDAIPGFKGLFEEAVEAMKSSDNRSRWGGPGMAMRVDGSFV